METDAPVVNIRETAGAAVYPALVAIWRSTVDTTHEFLSPEHRAEIENRLEPKHFPTLVVSVAEQD